jgi:16S rRNA (adenine1518-N6/adenine1519-N6)-dimethyltransferase
VSRVTIRPKQSLGQNFLVDGNIVRKIISAVAPNRSDVIVEIGPGLGVLTDYLVDQAGRVIAVEIDRRLAVELQRRLDSDNFTLLTGDFLKMDLVKLADRETIRIVGNIPYHITSPVIFKAFEHRDIVRDMTLMIQREVAERIVAKPRTKAYGILSVYSQLYSRPRIRFIVSRNVFKPRPEVDSAIVQWDFSKAVPVPNMAPDLLDKIVHLTFQQRRKMLRRSLKQLPRFDGVADRLTLDFNRRPEELTPLEFVELSNMIHNLWMT